MWQEDIEDVEQVCRPSRSGVKPESCSRALPLTPPAHHPQPRPAKPTRQVIQRLNLWEARGTRRSSPNMGLQVWLITSRQTAPDLRTTPAPDHHRADGRAGGAGREAGSCMGAHFVHIWMKEAIAEADRGRLVWVALWKLDVHPPAPPLIRACPGRNQGERQPSSGRLERAWACALSLGPWKTT